MVDVWYLLDILRRTTVHVAAHVTARLSRRLLRPAGDQSIAVSGIVGVEDFCGEGDAKVRPHAAQGE